MAMPPRSSKRRGGPQRWLVVPLAVTIVVLLVDASMHARSPQVQRNLDDQAWVDAVLPQVANSSAEGIEVANVATGKLSVAPETVTNELSGIAARAASTYRSVRADVPPRDMATAAGLLDACLAAREQGAEQLSVAVRDLLVGGGAPSAVAQMSSAANDFQLSDNAYALFVKDMPKSAQGWPSSRWADGSGPFGPSSLTAFSRRLLADRASGPPKGVTIDAVSTQPRALSVSNGVDVLSPAGSLSVTVVVANGSAVSESGVTVTASIAPSEQGGTQTETRSVDLAAGQAVAVTIGGLAPRPSVTTALTVSASLGGDRSTGSGRAGATRQLRIVVPGPNFTGVPSTTPVAPSTSSTVAGLGASSTTATS